MTNVNHSDALVQADGNVAAGNGVNENALDVKGPAELHEVLNEVLGTSYKSPEDAVKGMKETRDYVGKAGKYAKAVEAVVAAKGVSEDEAVKFIMDTVQNPTPVEQTKVETPVKTDEFVSKADFEKAMFYKDNPDLVPYKSILDSLAVGGKTLADAAKDETFTSLVTAKKAQDDVEKSKSVLTGNGRLANVTDKLTQAKTALSEGKGDVAEAAAVDAVLESMNLK